MAEKIVSPGVFTRERDQSFLIQGVSQIGAAIVGPFSSGPSFQPTIIDSQADLDEIFGAPAGTYYTPYTAQDYLKRSGVVTIVRVNGIGGYNQLEPIILTAEQDGSGSSVVAVLSNTKQNSSDLTGFANASITQSVGGTFALTSDVIINLDAGSNIISSSVDPASVDYLSKAFGISALGLENAYVYKLYEATLDAMKTNGAALTMSIETPTNTALNFPDDAIYASTPWIKSQLINAKRYDLFRFHTIGDGDAANQNIKISIEQIKAAGTISGTDYGSFNVVVRRFGDTDKRPEIVEQFNGCNINPTSPNYVLRVIGDRYITIASDGKLSRFGDWTNKSKFIRAAAVASDEYPVAAIPVAFDPMNITVIAPTASNVPAVSYKTVLSTDDTHYGMIVTNEDTLQYFAAVPSGSESGSNTVFSLDTDVGLNISGSTSALVTARRFTVGFQGGFDGKALNIPVNLGTDIIAGNSQGFDLTASTSSGSVAYIKALNAISNQDEFDINLLVIPGAIRRLHSSVVTKGIDLCEAREDCFYIADFTAPGDTITQAIDEAGLVDSNYAGTYYPWIKILDSNTNQLITAPPSALMVGVFAENDRVAAEWWAPAGLNRGGITQAVDVLNVLTRAERDDLYDGKVNPIASFPGQGISAWGQKTLQSAPSALDRINVRRLLINLKKYIASTTRFLVFEQNTATTRNKFLNLVNPYMDSVQQRQGLHAFRVVMDESNNTPDVIDRNQLVGQIFIQPTRTAEFIIIDFNIQATGASFSA